MCAQAIELAELRDDPSQARANSAKNRPEQARLTCPARQLAQPRNALVRVKPTTQGPARLESRDYPVTG